MLQPGNEIVLDFRRILILFVATVPRVLLRRRLSLDDAWGQCTFSRDLCRTLSIERRLLARTSTTRQRTFPRRPARVRAECVFECISARRKRQSDKALKRLISNRMKII